MKRFEALKKELATARVALARAYMRVMRAEFRVQLSELDEMLAATL